MTTLLPEPRPANPRVDGLPMVESLFNSAQLGEVVEEPIWTLLGSGSVPN